MIRVIRSDDKEFEFGKMFKILTLEGAGETSFENISQKKAFGNGDIIIGKRIPSRIINITSDCMSSAINNIARETARLFFNPNYVFKLYINYKGIERWIPCNLDMISLPTNNIHHPQILNLAFYCPDPFFRSVDEFGKNIALVTPAFGYPWFSTSSKGFIFGIYNFANKVFIDNDGDVETFCKAIIKMKGTVENFRLLKNDDEFVEVMGTFKKKDEIVMDFINAKITLNGEVINNRMNRRSKFFSIDIGGSDIKYSASVGSNVVEVYIFYNKLYLEV